MDDPGFVRGLQRLRDLLPDRQRLIDGDRPFGDPVGEVGPSNSSSTSARVPSASSMPWMAAMFGWLRLARICASR